MTVPQIIAIANAKGGVAKTTTAVTLAQILADRGNRVGVLDLDRQATARQWAANAAANGAPLGFDIIEWAGHAKTAIPAAVHAAREQYDHIVVDSSPSDMSDLSHALRFADVLIIPLLAMPADFGQFVALHRSVGDLPVYGLLTKARDGLRNVDEVRNWLRRADAVTGRRLGLDKTIPLREAEVAACTFACPPPMNSDLYRAYEAALGELSRRLDAELTAAR